MLLPESVFSLFNRSNFKYLQAEGVRMGTLVTPHSNVQHFFTLQYYTIGLLRGLWSEASQLSKAPVICEPRSTTCLWHHYSFNVTLKAA